MENQKSSRREKTDRAVQDIVDGIKKQDERRRRVKRKTALQGNLQSQVKKSGQFDLKIEDFPEDMRGEILRAANLLKKFDPVVRSYPDAVALQVAQLGILYGIDLFSPEREIWVTEGDPIYNGESWEQGPPEIFFGIYYYRNKAADLLIWKQRPTMIKPSQFGSLTDYSVPEGSIGAAFGLVTTVSAVRSLTEIGATFTEAVDMTAKEVFAHIGEDELTEYYVEGGQKKKRKKKAVKGRSVEWQIKQRVERAAFKELSVVPTPSAIRLRTDGSVDLSGSVDHKEETVEELNEVLF